MKYSKEHSIGKITAILLAFVLLLPVSVKLTHTLENHKHEVCTSKDAKHYHEIDHDCEFHKFKLNNPLSFTAYNFELVQIPQLKSKPVSHYYFISEFQQLHFKLRGPPQLI